MQNIFDPGCSPEEYQKQGKAFPCPDLTKRLCPQCKAALLKKHGFYSRWLCVIGFSGGILVRRFICKKCKKTVSLLPSFAHPRMSYGIQYVMAALKLFYLNELTVTQATQAFQNDTGLNCPRQLLRQFRIRLKENLNRLITEIIVLLKLQSPPVTAPANEKRERARQFLECIQSYDPQDVSLKLFERSGTTFLAPLTN